MNEVTIRWFDVKHELPQEEGEYLVTCQVVDGDEKFTDVSIWQDDQWEITMPGNERIRPVEVIAWSPFPDPA